MDDQSNTFQNVSSSTKLIVELATAVVPFKTHNNRLEDRDGLLIVSGYIDFLVERAVATGVPAAMVHEAYGEMVVGKLKHMLDAQDKFTDTAKAISELYELMDGSLTRRRVPMGQEIRGKTSKADGFDTFRAVTIKHQMVELESTPRYEVVEAHAPNAEMIPLLDALQANIVETLVDKIVLAPGL